MLACGPLTPSAGSHYAAALTHGRDGETAQVSEMRHESSLGNSLVRHSPVKCVWHREINQRLGSKGEAFLILSKN